MAWISPTGFVDDAGTWSSENLAYDEDTGLYASETIGSAGWGNYLELTHFAIDCDKLQIWSGRSTGNITDIEVGVYYNSAWNNIYSGACTFDSWVEYAMGSTQSITSLRVRYYSDKANRQARVHEADFNEIAGGVTEQLAGISNGVCTVSGDLKVSKKLVGVSAGVASVSGVVKISQKLSGVCAGAASVSGAVKVSKKIAGTITGVASVAGTMSRIKGLGGISNGIAAVSGAIKLTKGLSGISAGIASVSGAIKVTRKLAGIASGIATVSGIIKVKRGLSGIVTGKASVTGELTVSEIVLRILRITSFIGEVFTKGFPYTFPFIFDKQKLKIIPSVSHSMVIISHLDTELKIKGTVTGK